MRRDFRDKVVAITGGAGGIGRALGEVFLEAGAKVALLDLDPQRLSEVAAELEDPEHLAVFTCDVRSYEACEAAVAGIRARFGGIDVLINNAGLVHRSAFAQTDVAVFRRVMEVNWLGAVHCTRAALDALVARRGLVIVTSSVAGLTPLLGRPGYAASKHALHGFFESLRPELQPHGVNVLMVCPGFTDSGFDSRALGGDGRLATRARTQVGGTSTPRDVAHAVLRAAQRNRRRVILSPIGKLARVLSLIAPRFYDRLMMRNFAAEVR